jgi:hypothetical protein
MKIFISWSENRSQAMAAALRDWLPLVLHYAKPWLSQTDIRAGDRWALEIAKELENSFFGVICLTRDNLDSPWILFEAGALAKSIEKGAVIPLLLDLDFSELIGPLAQFQAKKTERNSVYEVVRAINERSEVPVEEGRLLQLFEFLWPQLEAKFRAIPSHQGESPIPPRSQKAILEDLVITLRAVDQRTRDLEAALPHFAAMAGIALDSLPVDQDNWEPKARRLWAQGKKIEAISIVRRLTGMNLKDAKKLTDSWIEGT